MTPVVAALLLLPACESRKGAAPPQGQASRSSFDAEALARGERRALLAALTQDRSATFARLGAHRGLITSRQLVKDGKRERTVNQRVELRFDKNGQFSIIKTTGPQHGVELRWVGGALYPRQRFSSFYRRTPKDPREPLRLAGRLSDLLPAYIRLLEPRLNVALKGKEERGGRSLLKLSLALNVKRSAKKAPRGGSARRWRGTVDVEALKGRALVDAKSGAVLEAKLEARFAYRRAKAPDASGIPKGFGEGRSEVTLSFEQRLEVGPGAAVVIPDKGAVVDIRRRRLELEQRMVLGERPIPPGWRERWGDIKR